MPKVIITPELSTTIKALRTQNKVTAKNVATAIGRSASYVSKLENNGVKSMEYKEFEKLLTSIGLDNSSTEELKEQFLTEYNIRYSIKEREEQLWFVNLDTVWRKLPIPKDLVDKILELLSETDITVARLVDRINNNEELTEQDSNNPNLPINEWFENSDDPMAKHSIKMQLDCDVVERILNREKITSNYVTILALVHYLLKFKLFGENSDLSDQQLRQVSTETKKILGESKFYTVEQKGLLLAQSHSKLEEERILNDFDISNREIINSILENFSRASDSDIVVANKTFDQFRKTLDWDIAFALNYIGLPWSEIGECSHSHKVSIIREIVSIIKRYKAMSDSEKKMGSLDYGI